MRILDWRKLQGSQSIDVGDATEFEPSICHLHRLTEFERRIRHFGIHITSTGYKLAQCDAADNDHT